MPVSCKDLLIIFNLCSTSFQIMHIRVEPEPEPVSGFTGNPGNLPVSGSGSGWQNFTGIGTGFGTRKLTFEIQQFFFSLAKSKSF